MVDDFAKESPGANCGIENCYSRYKRSPTQHALGYLEHCRVSEPVREPKIRLQDVFDAPDNVAHHWFRSVVNPPHFSDRRIVFGQEGFVEVDYRVFSPRPFAKVLQNSFDIRLFQKLGKVVDHPGQPLVQVRPCYVAEYLAQERVGPW